MKEKEFYHFFANGKRYDLLKDAKFIYFIKETRYRKTASYQFVYNISDSQFRDHRNSIFVSLRLKFDPLKYYSYETGKEVGSIEASEIMRIDDSPHAILSKMKSISNCYFNCKKKLIDKLTLIQKMEEELNSYWRSGSDQEFYITYEELYNL